MAKARSRRRSVPEVPLSLPPFVEELLGNEAPFLLEALRAPAPVSVRSNPFKPTPRRGAQVPWCSHGQYLDQRPVFTLDPLFHAGAYYVQEAASMLLEQAVMACGTFARSSVALDLCAAPGGKSTHLASLIPADALLVANEPVRARQAALQENIWKWGRPGVVITGSLPEAFAPLGEWCDLVVVDAPCSGEGMFRKDPFARSQWSEELVDQCAVRQHGIVESAWNALRPGGHLIYSTCTWEEKENEGQLSRLIDQGAVYVPIPVDPNWGVRSATFGLRCYPHRLKGEGFFIAVLRKPGKPEPPVMVAHAATDLDPRMDAWLRAPEGMCSIPVDGTLHAISKSWGPLVDALMREVRVIAPGLPVAFPKGKSVAPHPALALSTELNIGAFATLEVDTRDALHYLRGEALMASDAKGTVLLRHKALPLGWAHGAGNRWNNGWPPAWRIRMR